MVTFVDWKRFSSYCRYRENCTYPGPATLLAPIMMSHSLQLRRSERNGESLSTRTQTSRPTHRCQERVEAQRSSMRAGVGSCVCCADSPRMLCTEWLPVTVSVRVDACVTLLPTKGAFTHGGANPQHRH